MKPGYAAPEAATSERSWSRSTSSTNSSPCSAPSGAVSLEVFYPNPYIKDQVCEALTSNHNRSPSATPTVSSPAGPALTSARAPALLA